MFGEVKMQESIFNDKLIIGNHESLLLFGAEAQAKLRDFSKAISEVTIRKNTELEDILSEVVDEIEVFQKGNDSNKLFHRFASSNIKDRSLIRRYEDLLDHMDKVSLEMQLQQAQLIKDIKCFDRLEEIIKESILEFDKCLQEGEQVRNNCNTSSEKTDISEWLRRFENRMRDIDISRTIANQSLAQLYLMKENERTLVDKIVAAISSTIPIWRNQVTMLLGIEKINSNTDVQEIIMTSMKKTLVDGTDQTRKQKKKQQVIDKNKLCSNNIEITAAFDELIAIEKRDSAIKNETNNILLK